MQRLRFTLSRLSRLCTISTLLFGVGALATNTCWAQPTYTNNDIDALRVRYEPPKPKASGVSKLRKTLWGKAYQDPKYVPWLLPYQAWEQEYKAYFWRHYRERSITFKPSLICMHYTVVPSAASVYDMFCRGTNMCAGDEGTVFGHVSVHLMIDKDGTVYQLLPFDRRCTGAYGVNHKAISIEMVATSEGDLLSRPVQLYNSFCVVRNLMRKYNIPLTGIIAHSDVSDGKDVVPDYTDYADSKYPDRYPSSSKRTDPGPTYMAILRDYLAVFGPAPAAGRADKAKTDD